MNRQTKLAVASYIALGVVWVRLVPGSVLILVFTMITRTIRWDHLRYVSARFLSAVAGCGNDMVTRTRRVEDHPE